VSSLATQSRQKHPPASPPAPLMSPALLNEGSPPTRVPSDVAAAVTTGFEMELPSGAAVLGQSVTVKGWICSGENLTIEGEVEGTIEIKEHCLIVGSNGNVYANITAREVVVAGSIHGNVKALERVYVCKDATVVGDIQTAAIVIEDGGYIKGGIDISRQRPCSTGPCNQPAVELSSLRIPPKDFDEWRKNSVSDVAVSKIETEGEDVLLRIQQADALYDEIRRRAFHRFESRGGTHGYDREDWFAAERSLIFAPPAELVEEGDQFGIRLTVPGFEPEQVRVTVIPGTIMVDGDPAQASEPQGHVWFSEFSDRKLLRRFDLPQEVRTYTVKATVKDGILRINAKKAAQGGDRVQQAAAVGA
jgi:HSP20 family molecular chaperone IbpA/cytoskeletal protein CcmA (bactofilin family)